MYHLLLYVVTCVDVDTTSLGGVIGKLSCCATLKKCRYFSDLLAIMFRKCF